MAQLPQEAAGTFAGVLVYSLVCLAGSITVLLLSWHHKDRTSYVAFLAFFTTLSTLCSIIQQIHDMVFWIDIRNEQFANMKANPGSPVLVLANGSVGMDLALFYIQFYSYSAEALLVLFWALAIMQYVYKLTEIPRLRQPLKVMNCLGVFASIGFPVMVIILLQIQRIQSSFQGFLLLAGQPLIWSLFVGALVLLSIFIAYLRSQPRFQHLPTSAQPQPPRGYYGERAPTTASSVNSSLGARGMYDRWLIARFSIAFVIMSAFEVTIVLFTMAATGNIRQDLERTKADVSPERARSTWLLFMPGVTASLLMFIVFGTTKNNLAYMGSCFCPHRRDRTSSCPRRRPVISSPRLQANTHSFGDIGDAPDMAMSKPSLSHQSSLRSDIRPAPRPPTAAAAAAAAAAADRARLHLGSDLMKPLPPTPLSQTPLPPTPEISEVVARELFRNDIRRPLDWRQRDAYSGKRFAPR